MEEKRRKEQAMYRKKGGRRKRGAAEVGGWFVLDLPSAKGMTDWILFSCLFKQRHQVLRHLSAYF